MRGSSAAMISPLVVCLLICMASLTVHKDCLKHHPWHVAFGPGSLLIRATCLPSRVVRASLLAAVGFPVTVAAQLCRGRRCWAFSVLVSVFCLKETNRSIFVSCEKRLVQKKSPPGGSGEVVCLARRLHVLGLASTCGA